MRTCGEWNTIEIVCKTNTIDVIVNGVLQNKATGVSDASGHICSRAKEKLLNSEMSILQN